MEPTLLIISCGVLGYEIVFSDLSFYVRRFLFLDREYPQLMLLSAFKAHRKILGRWVWLLLPISIPIVMISGLWRFIQKLLECPFCTSFWVGMAGGFVTGLTITQAVITALCSMAACAVYNLIRMKSI